MKQPSNEAVAGSNRAVLLEGEEHKLLWKLAAPMIIAVQVMSTQAVVNSYFLGRWSEHALNMAAFAAPLCWLTSAAFVGYGTGVTSAVSRAMGSGSAGVDVLGRGGMAWGVVISLAMSALGLMLGGLLYPRLGLSDDALPLMQVYMDCWWLGLPCVAITLTGTALLRGAGETRRSGGILILVSLLNIALDPLLIFGLGPIPALGAFGASLATVLSWVLGAVLTLRLMQRQLRLFRGLAAPVQMRSAASTIMPVAIPAISMFLVGPVGGTVLAAIAAKSGEAEVTAFGVAARVYGFAEFLPIALSSGLAPLVGQNFAAGRHARVVRAVRFAQRDSILWGVVVAMIVCALAQPIAGIFTSDPLTIERLVVALRFWMLALASSGMIRITASAFNAVGNGMRAAGITFLRFLVFPIPLAVFGLQLFGFYGTLAAIPLAAMLSHALAALWLHRSGLAVPVDDPALVSAGQQATAVE